MPALVVAAISARVLAEEAVADGFEVIALDLFGDADTRRASARWIPIGRPPGLRIDAALLLAALRDLARRSDVVGWIAGSGFEGQPELLERGAALLPLIGTGAQAVRRISDPRSFFGVLDAQGIDHPAVRMEAPADAAGWLLKDASGCGGWHIRHAEAPGAAAPAEPLPAQRYFQRRVGGTPMSATFVANGSDARVLGFNRLLVRRLGARPFVFCGALGPVPLAAGPAAGVESAVRGLARAFALRGLGSLDFMLDGDRFEVLEVNPRPPASMALYGRHFAPRALQDAGPGVVALHLRASLDAELPPAGQLARGGFVHGFEIVYAPRRLRLDEGAAQGLSALAGCHDLPAAASRFDRADPLCSVSASGVDAESLRALLGTRRDAVHALLEKTP